jgi:t-SNARE complex subunit (syntaxin)
MNHYTKIEEETVEWGALEDCKRELSEKLNFLEQRLTCLHESDFSSMDPTKAEKKGYKCWELHRNIEKLLATFGKLLLNASKDCRTAQSKMVKQNIENFYRESQDKFEALIDDLMTVARNSTYFRDSNFRVTQDELDEEDKPQRKQTPELD